jgi:hypothetical protein
MTSTYDFWQNKRSGHVFAIKFVRGRPERCCGPLADFEFRASDGRLLRFRLGLLHYGFRFEEDPYDYLVRD